MLILPKAKKTAVAGATALSRIKKIVATATLAVSLALAGAGSASAMTTNSPAQNAPRTEIGSLVLAPASGGPVVAQHWSHSSHASHASHDSHASHASHYSSRSY